MYILDTDHVSLFQRNHPNVVARILSTPYLKLATTIITLEEQLRGRLGRIRRAKGDEEIVNAYKNLLATFYYFDTIIVIGLDHQAQTLFQTLRAQKIRVGTQDLRIAAISLRQGATLVTRNRRDFEAIPNLKIEDWSG